MKKLFFGIMTLVSMSTFAQESKLVPDFVRASIYSIRLDSPISSQGDFSTEEAIMKNCFDTLNYEEHFRKYNAFGAGPRVMKSEVKASKEQLASVVTTMGHKEATDIDQRAADILAQLEANKVGNSLVYKWFCKEGCEDGVFQLDTQYMTIVKWGLMSITDDQKREANGEKPEDIAKNMVNPLLNSTYVIVTDFDFLTGPEMVQKKIDEKTAPLYAKLAKAPAMLQETIKNTIQTTIDETKSTLEESFPAEMKLVEAHSYLYRLIWDGDEIFYRSGITDDFSKADYHLEFVETASGYAALVSSAEFGSAERQANVVAKKTISALDKNIIRLGNKCPDFSPVEMLYTNENGNFYVKCGTEEGLTTKSTVTPLQKVIDKKTGDVVLKAAGSLNVAKDGLWNNNKDADDIDSNLSVASSEGNSSLSYTLLTGSAKNCSYVKIVDPKAYKAAEKKAAEKAKK